MIPFNSPISWPDETAALLAEAHRSRRYSGDGPLCERAASLLSELHNGAVVYLTPSCTHALEAAVFALDLEPGDEVIVPDFTFTSTATAVVQAGGVPVFADITPSTLNIDPPSVEACLSDRTRAVMAVNYAGIACDFAGLGAITRQHELHLIEDNAHGLGATFEGRPLGTFSRFSTLSFHETKNVNCGEGGAIVLNDRSDIERVEVLREKGTNRSAFFRGSVAKYNWVGRGSSWLLAEPLAAFLIPQLESVEAITERRTAIWSRYAEALTPWAAENDVQLPHVPAGASHPGHLFFLVMNDLDNRQRLIRHLAENEILAPFHYQSLSESPAGRRFGRVSRKPETAISVSDRLLRLPLFFDLSDDEVERVIDTVVKYQVTG